MKRKIKAWFPLIVWLTNVLAVVLSYFVNMMWAGLPLFLAMFVVWGPAVMRVRKWSREGEPLFRKKPPAWVIAAAVVSVIYTFVNIILCMVRMDEGRLFVGHLLAFTGLSMLFLWPESEKPDQDGAERGVDG